MKVVSRDHIDTSWVRPYRAWMDVCPRGNEFVAITSETQRRKYNLPEYTYVPVDDYDKYGETIILHAMTAAAHELGLV